MFLCLSTLQLVFSFSTKKSVYFLLYLLLAFVSALFASARCVTRVAMQKVAKGNVKDLEEKKIICHKLLSREQTPET